MSLFLSISQIILAVVIGSATVCISYRQMHIEKSKIKIDLFDRRYDAYKKVSDIYIESKSYRRTDLDQQNYAAFYTSCEFIFPENIHSQIKSIVNDCVKLVKIIKKHGYDGSDEAKSFSDELDKKFLIFESDCKKLLNIFDL